MIVRLIFAALVLYAIFRFVKLVQSKKPEQRRSYYTSLVIGLAAAGLVLMSLTGRVHWIAGLIGAAMPFIRQFVVSHLHRKISESAGAGRQQPPPQRPAAQGISRADALSILGLSEGASREDIINAHRKLMQKLHPDRGGNDYLASQLNAAKSCLLDD